MEVNSVVKLTVLIPEPVATGAVDVGPMPVLLIPAFGNDSVGSGSEMALTVTVMFTGPGAVVGTGDNAVEFSVGASE